MVSPVSTLSTYPIECSPTPKGSLQRSDIYPMVFTTFKCFTYLSMVDKIPVLTNVFSSTILKVHPPAALQRLILQNGLGIMYYVYANMYLSRVLSITGKVRASYTMEML